MTQGCDGDKHRVRESVDAQIQELAVGGCTGLGSNQYDRKMIPKVLTPKCDHTRSGLHENYHILFLDSLSLSCIFWNTVILQCKKENFSPYAKFSPKKCIDSDCGISGIKSCRISWGIWRTYQNIKYQDILLVKIWN